MSDILHDLSVKAPVNRVFEAVSTPAGLDCWWTKPSAGRPSVGAEYEFWFGPQYDWRAEVTSCMPGSEFELRMTRADADWNDTRVGFQIEDRLGKTWIRFYHTGWPSANEHYRISCNCWALYLRILRRYLEQGEMVPYERRLD